MKKEILQLLNSTDCLNTEIAIHFVKGGIISLNDLKSEFYKILDNIPYKELKIEENESLNLYCIKTSHSFIFASCYIDIYFSMGLVDITIKKGEIENVVKKPPYVKCIINYPIKGDYLPKNYRNSKTYARYISCGDENFINYTNKSLKTEIRKFLWKTIKNLFV